MLGAPLDRIFEVLFLVLGISCWNPAFDVTPASFIAGIITERGVLRPYELAQVAKDSH